MTLPSDALFRKFDSGSIQEYQRREVEKAISAYEPTDFLNASDNDLVNFLVERYRLDVPELKGEIEARQEDSQMSISRGSRFAFGYDYDEPSAQVPSTRFHFYVPFSGDEGLFKCKPSTYELNLVRAEVSDSELHFTYETPKGEDPNTAKSQFEADLSQVRKNLERLRSDLSSFNTSLADFTRTKVLERRAKLEADQKAVESFGYKVREVPPDYSDDRPLGD